jgi:hypothetical protein
MNKVRVILIEADGSDAIMSQALAGFLAALHPAETPLPPPIPSRPTLELIPSAAPAPAIAERVKPVRVKARQGRLPLAKPDANDGNTRAAVIAALSKRPMTSSELIKETGLTAPAIYSMTGYMRNQGELESKQDDSSIYKKHHLVKR